MISSFKSSRRLRHAAKRSSAFKDMLFLKNKFVLPLLLLTFTLTGCGIYNGGWERGGELTSSFLERIQETDKDREDYS